MTRHGWKSAIGASLLLLATVASAQDRANDELLRIVTSLAAQVAARVAANRLGAGTGSNECDLAKPKPDDVCTISIARIRYPDDPNGKYYCIAQVPDVKVPHDPSPHLNTKRRIAWELDVDSLNDGTQDRKLWFHHDYGILVLDDPAHQVDRMGDLGDGLPGPVNERRFHTWTRRNLLDAVVSYVPVILWGDGKDAQLCAAVDPKIVNVQ